MNTNAVFSSLIAVLTFHYLVFVVDGTSADSSFRDRKLSGGAILLWQKLLRRRLLRLQIRKQRINFF